MMPKELAEVFQDTLNRIDTDSELLQCTRKMQNDTRLYLPQFTAYDYNQFDTPADIEVTEDTTFHCAMRNYRVDHRTAVLNFANAYTPGGSVKDGADAQEESLCQCSNLYKSLTMPYLIRNYYKFNSKNTGAMGSDAVIYSPNVTVIRSDEYEIFDPEKRFSVDVISCAAPYYDAGKKRPVAMTKLQEVFRQRIKNILEVASSKKVDTLILGAFGCGAFHNPPELVASAFYELLIERQYARRFRKVIFAIRENADKRNFDTFCHIFGKNKETGTIKVSPRMGDDKMKGKNNQPYLSGMLGLITGDALGVPAEFKSRDYLKKNPVTCMEGYGSHYQEAGTWSDDSSMALATLESLQRGFNLEDIMNNFVAWSHEERFTPRGTIFDIGGATRRSIRRYERDHNVYTCGEDNPNSNGNGSLMRILPLCIYADQEEQKEMTTDEAVKMIHEVSALTHAYPVSLIGCGLYYFCVKAILHETGSLAERLQNGIDRGMDFYNDPKWEEKYSVWFRFHYELIPDLDQLRVTDEDQIKSGGYVVDTFTAALWCLLNTDTYANCVLKAVNLGNDTDTTAAVAGGLAGLFYGYDRIPKDWIEMLARRDEIENLCRNMDELIVK